MLIKNNKTISSVIKGSKVIDKIIKGTLVVYESFKNLIASGIPPLTLTKSKGVDLVDYKIYGNSEQGILPSEYQQAEYIESTGTQYIDTGFIPDNNSRFVLKTNMTKYKGWAFGVQDNSLVSFDFGFAVSTSADISKSLVCYARTSYIIEESYHNKVVTIDLNKNKCYIDDVLINEFEETALISLYPVYLFSGNSYGNANTRSRIKVYSFEIYDNDNLVRNFIPCYRKSDNVIGLYDLVNNTFYTNQGTGTFLKGSNVSVPPTPDTPIEVESVGEYDETTGKYKIPVKVSNEVEEITTNIYLNEPLRKIKGNTNEFANWVDVFDYIDFENSKVVRNIRKANINEFTWNRRTGSTSYIFETTDPTFRHWSNPFCNMCDNTKYSPTSGIALMKTSYLIKGNANATLHKIYISDYIDTTVEEFLDTFNGAYIVYALATPIEETIELPNIPTIKGTTILEVDTNVQPSNVEVVYKCKA